MNKVIKNQIENLIPDNIKIEELKNFISAVENRYESLEKKNKLLEQALEYTTKEFLFLTVEANNNIDILKEMQADLMHSEKMAALGSLIAGIAHEINSPVAAITASIVEIKTDSTTILKNILLPLKEEIQSSNKNYVDLCLKTLELNKNYSTSEKRAHAKEIEKLFSSHKIEPCQDIARQLSMIGFTQKEAQEYIELFKSTLANDIISLIFMVGTTQIHLNDMQIATSRISNLLRALKIYSHSDIANMSATDLEADLNNTLTILASKLRHGIHVTTHYEKIAPVWCFADQLGQVWLNLLNNAIEAMKGQGNLIIRLYSEEDKHVVIEIEDDGPGIAPEIMKKIFLPYFTTKRKGEGTGLGLSISKQIIDKHKGKIEVSSQKGKTVFKVIIPINVEKTNE